MKRIMVALLTLCAVPAAAQAPTAAGSVKPLFAQGAAWVLAAAEQMPEADYGFKPTPEIRSFGQVVGHVVNAQYMFCSAIKGEASPSQQNWEQVTEKAALVEALRASTAYCDAAYDLSDEAAMQSMTFFGRPMTKLGVLTMNAAHDFEHYGNIVTYMRLKGMTPPSSQGN
ncbi:DinB family protein [Longimicrobium sp.]|uniref:DinB family protein n=1 Tax=Longimicrobium sp. TaxID=2029185 RepID=UPI003B3A1F79